MAIKAIILYIFGIFLVCSPLLSYAQKNNQSHVNILTWSGYISEDDPNLRKIEDDCNTKISYDQYDSNDEFLDRFQENKNAYNIIIFSDTIFKLIFDKIKNNRSDLYLNAKNYNHIIYQHYQHRNFPHNVAFFVHSMTGFLYNKKIVNLTESDTVYSMFHKAGNNTVVMIDDAVEAEFLLSLGIRQMTEFKAKFDGINTLIPLTLDNFEKLYQSSSVIITNSFQKISTMPSFAFSYQWSGDAIASLQYEANLQYLIHPKLSYVSSDLIANLDNNESTLCVANALSSRAFLSHMQNKTYYFSPYGDKPVTKNHLFTQVYDIWLKELPDLFWIDSVTKARFVQLQREWNLIKLQLDEDNSKKSAHE